jgi:hypothetical protein
MQPSISAFEFAAVSRSSVMSALRCRKAFWLERCRRFLQQTPNRDTAITAVDPKCKCLRLKSGEEFGFDKLIVATGARPRTVDTPGAKLRNVHYLRCWMIPRPVSADRIANSAGFKTIRPGGISRNHSSAKNYELGFVHTSLRLRKMRSWSWSGNSKAPDEGDRANASLPNGSPGLPFRASNKTCFHFGINKIQTEAKGGPALKGNT